MEKQKVLAICGSTRQHSINHSLVKAITNLSADRLDITLSGSIALLPQFNPDADGDPVHAQVNNFRKQIDQADGVIICTPEYAHGVPGSLKNAIDWTVSSCQFPQKPTMLITAATDGHFGHRALLETLKAIEARNVDKLQAVINFAKTKINDDGEITDAATLEMISDLIETFIQTIQDKKSGTNNE